jgi:beta-1,4-N-acetylglucosaminyltransferase
MSNHIPTEPATGLLRREAFVTVGATAAFRSLIDASISLSFLSTLSRLGYTHLTIQCGPDLAYFNEKFEAEKDSLQQPLGSLKIRTFDFNTLGLGQEMRGCKGVPGTSREGVVVCHAGAGTILDAMRIGVPLIVVPNTDLLDNHQAELAVELEKQGYVTHGKLRYVDRDMLRGWKTNDEQWTCCFIGRVREERFG